MTRSTSTLARSRRLAIGSLAGVAAFAGVTASAEANFQKTLTYTCIYPYVGEQPLSVAIDAAIPSTWPTKTKTPAFQLSAVATAGGNTSAAIGLVGAATVEGSTKAGAIIAATGATPLPLTVPIAIPQQAAADSGDLVLNASGSTPQVQFANPGPAKITVESIALTLIVRGADGAVIQLPADATEVPQTDPDPDTFQVSCALAPATQDKTLAIIDVQPPGTPTPSPTPTPVPTGSPSVTPITTPTPSPTPTLMPVGTPPPSPTPTPTPSPSPTPPAPTPQATPPAGGGYALAGTRSAGVTFSTNQSAAKYELYDGSTKLAEIAASSLYIGGTPPFQYDSGTFSVDGLTPDTAYTWEVRSLNAAGEQISTRSFSFRTQVELATPTPVAPTPTPTVAPTPTPGPEQVIKYSYALAGSASLKTLVKGSLPLSGGIDAKLGLPSGNFKGDLSLAPTQGNLTALGFLPVVAKVNLVPTEQVSGSLKNNKLTAVAKVRIKLPSVKTLGIELAGGANCQAKQISSITLNSTQPTFLPLSGGPLAGTFAISDLSGCGFLNGIVSALTAGSGNTIALNLTPRPVPAGF